MTQSLNQIHVLGLETSCDETAAAIVSGDGTILSNKVLSQIDVHELHGGVVPEIAAREHLSHLEPLISAAFAESGLDVSDLSAVAATAGPGLIGGVMVGMMTGKAIAASGNLPFFAINHLEGHALSPRLADQGLDFPYLLLLVSGAHTALVEISGVGRYETFGSTLDDALGEVFDKSGKMLGLPYPGGPHIEKMAATCQDTAAAEMRFPLPRPMKGRKDLAFSFSGLKTAVKTHVDSLPAGEIARNDAADLCHALQVAVADILSERCKKAMQLMTSRHGGPVPLVVAGGVAANQVLRQSLTDLASDYGVQMIAPPLALCSDNGAMIAWAGIENMRYGIRHDFDAPARPRWPLDGLSTSCG